MRLIDLPKIPQEIHRRLEQRSEEKGRELADDIIASTRGGRGLWIFLLLPAWVMVFAVTASVAQAFWGIPLLVGAIAGAVTAMIWWKLEFTRRHPFLSSTAACIGLPALIVFAGK